MAKRFATDVGFTVCNEALQFKIADMNTELVAARQMVRLAAFKLDTNDSEKTTYCAMAKRFATDVGFTVCNDALQIHGGYGYIKEYPLERQSAVCVYGTPVPSSQH